jgi:hypothetical protein
MSFMGGIEKLSKSAFNTKRSALKSLFKDYGQGAVYDRNVSPGIASVSKGLMREIAQAGARGETKLGEGTKPLSFSLHCAMALLMLQDSVSENGHQVGAFSHLFFAPICFVGSHEFEHN